MPRGYRSYIAKAGVVVGAAIVLTVAAVLIYNAWSLQRAYQIEASQAAHDASNQAEIQIQRDCAPLPEKAKYDCQRQITQANRQNAREEYDLEAQRTTAIWTAFMGAAALIGMSFSIIGVGLVYITFRATRAATDAAYHANILTRFHGEREHRPRLGVSTRRSSIRREGDAYFVSFNLSIQSRALEVADDIKLACTLLPSNRPEAEFRAYHAAHARPINQPIGPDMPYTTEHENLGPFSVEMVERSGGLKIGSQLILMISYTWGSDRLAGFLVLIGVLSNQEPLADGETRIVEFGTEGCPATLLDRYKPQRRNN